MENKVNKDCIIHRRNCQMFCTYSKCEVKILCGKCVIDHLKVHPRHFIYDVQNLTQVHGFDKVIKLKQILGKQKLASQIQIKAIYEPFESILTPLIHKVKQFEVQSKDLIVKQFFKFLAINKAIVETGKIQKSDPMKIKVEPEVMIQQTIAEVNIVNDKQNQLKQNIEKFVWYTNATAQMSASAQKQITQMSGLVIKLLQYYVKIQTNLFKQKIEAKDDLEYEPFYLKYMNLHKVASKVESNNLQLSLIESKKIMQHKDQQLLMAKDEIKDLLTKIDQLNNRNQRLKQQIFQLKNKQQREQRQRKQAISVAKQKLQQFIIRNQIVFNQGKCITLQKKNLDNKLLQVMFDMVKNPIQLILSQHNLTEDQLGKFLRKNYQRNNYFQQLKILRMSFMPIDKQFLQQALEYYENITTLQLNSCYLTDVALEQLSGHFPSKLKHLHLIDNKLTDQGIQKMFQQMNRKNIRFQSLYLSYNGFTPKAIDAINIYNYELKTLHISKNQIKNKGIMSIARCLKNLQQLFIGGTGVTKQGLVSICKNCLKLKKLSVVATQMSTDIVSQILLGLQKLEWLDISYSTLTQNDIKKIEKLREYNPNLEIVLQT